MTEKELLPQPNPHCESPVGEAPKNDCPGPYGGEDASQVKMRTTGQTYEGKPRLDFDSWGPSQGYVVMR